MFFDPIVATEVGIVHLESYWAGPGLQAYSVSVMVLGKDFLSMSFNFHVTVPKMKW